MIIQYILNQTAEDKLSPSLTVVTYHSLAFLVVKHPQCSAVIALQGAQLVHWQPKHTSSPVIWLSDKTALQPSVAIRGGIPICWPHFAELGTPMHGCARLLPWKLIEHREHESGMHLRLTVKDSAQSRAYLNNSFQLTLDCQLGLTCQLTLSCQAELQATAALHSYFTVSDINHIKVLGLGEVYQERLTTHNPPKVIGEMIFEQAVDRIYTQPAGRSLIHDRQRTLTINHHNASDVVVWNPGKDKCAQMPDMASDGYKNMVCVETARIHQPIDCTSQQVPAIIGLSLAVKTHP